MRAAFLSVWPSCAEMSRAASRTCCALSWSACSERRQSAGDADGARHPSGEVMHGHSDAADLGVELPVVVGDALAAHLLDLAQERSAVDDRLAGELAQRVRAE